MNRASWTILCLGYVIGLLSTGFFPVSGSEISSKELVGIGISLGALSAIAAFFIPRFWHMGPRWWLWIGAGVVAILAVVYFQLRTPEPSVNDISQIFLEENRASQLVTVEGKVLSQPRLTRTTRVQFWFKAIEVNQDKSQKQEVTGKLYVTVPLLQGTGVYPGQNLSVSGFLYQPKPAVNPGAFDFKAYLASEGSFAGLKGREIVFENQGNEPSWRLWKLRQRIVRAQVGYLGSPTGQLFSSMVLGGKAVDLPYDLRDRFIEAGLAHVFAASGFQVSLLLGVVVTITKRLSGRSQLITGFGILILYIGLTGVQASVMRAGLMGAGALFALVSDRKVIPLGSLLLAATILLLFNPLWIWDLGFELSFLATLGLIVTAPALQKRLDWLPPAIAAAIAVPIAASIWTLPLLMYVFNAVASYSILVNIISTPIVTGISLGGMVSAVVGIVFPIGGSAIAWLFYFPTHLLIWIVELFTSLPGSSFAVGKISLGVLILIYALYGLLWLSQWWQSRYLLVFLFIITLVIVPIYYDRLTLVKATVLSTTDEPVLVIQDRGKVVLVNSGEADTTRYTVLPFLAQQGINRIDCAIILNGKSSFSSGWSEISTRLSVLSKIDIQKLSSGKTLSVGSIKINSLLLNPPVLQLKIGDLTWLLLGKNKQAEKDTEGIELLRDRPQVLLWFGENWVDEWLEVMTPEVAIASSNRVEEKTLMLLQQKQIQFYLTSRDGAIQWTPKKGFEMILETNTVNDALL